MDISIIAKGIDLDDGPMLAQTDGTEIASKRLVVLGVDGNSLSILFDIKTWDEGVIPYLTDPEAYAARKAAETERAEARARIVVPGSPA